LCVNNKTVVFIPVSPAIILIKMSRWEREEEKIIGMWKAYAEEKKRKKWPHILIWTLK
jgi:hypothetical protein